MKRSISVVLVLLALGVAAFFFLKLRRFLPERSRAAELAPPETIFFAQFPNLRQTARRIPKTNLHRIWSEPDVQRFLEKPRQKAPWMRSWAELSEGVARVVPGECFVAVTSIDGRRPGFVGGFSYAGSRRAAESLAEYLRRELPPEGEVVSALREHWCLVASDAALLDALLRRLAGPPGAVPALAADPVFQQTVAPLGVGQDLVFYGKPEALAGRLDGLTGLGGVAKSTGTEPIAMATKLDGAMMHDTIFLRRAGPAQTGALSRQTLPLASPQTLLYYATESGQLQPGAEAGMLKTLLPSLARAEKVMSERGLTWADLAGAIGPELGAMLEWPEDDAVPMLLLAAEVRDPVKALAFREILTAPVTLGSVWRKEDHEGIAVSRAPTAALSFVRPAVALTDRFALLGLSLEAVTGALPRSRAPGPSLREAPSFQTLAPFLSARDTAYAYAYLDFQGLFERVYRMARPFISLSLAFSPEAGAHYDAGKLPPVEAISRHLGASILTQSRIDGGLLIESIGSVTIPELLVALGSGVDASALPDLSGLLPGGVPRLPAAGSPRLPGSSTRAASPPPKGAPPSATPVPMPRSHP